MVTGFDYLSKDKALKTHWLRRFVAIIIDSAIIYVPVYLLFVDLLGVNSLFVFLLTGLLFFMYAAIFDLLIGGTFGKMVMSLKSVSVSGQLDVAQALMRNISKLLPPLLLLDWIIGMLVDTRDPRQKWTDQLASTSVILHG